MSIILGFVIGAGVPTWLLRRWTRNRILERRTKELRRWMRTRHQHLRSGRELLRGAH